MLSRRRFLSANVAAALVPLGGTAAARPSTAPAPAESAPVVIPRPVRDYWNDWPLYLTARVNEARAARQAALSALRSEADVRARIEMVRSRVWELIGGPFEKTPLNPFVPGVVERKAYRIEKVIFESQPAVYVTAHLYIPAAGRPPYPAVLCPLGHAAEGKLYPSYQRLFQNLARKGYVVFAFDPFGQGERHQYLDPKTGRPRLGPTGEHSQAGKPLLLLGATFAQYRVWDGIRALDYLLTRPEVDPQRIGCTGHSGGGTMTMYLCALEPRIQVAVEAEGNSENLAGPDYDPPGAVADAEQNLVGGLPLGLDRGDLLLAFAPKPLRISYTVVDAGTTYSPAYDAGTREVYEELRAAYRLLGKEEQVDLFNSQLPHDYDLFSRRAAYEWFNRWLLKDPSVGTGEAEFDTSPPEVLRCTVTGEVLTSMGGRSVLRLNSDRLQALQPASASWPALDANQRRQRAREALVRLLALPSMPKPPQGTVLSSQVGEGMSFEEFHFESQPGLRIPGWLLRPSPGKPPFPVVLALSESGKDDIFDRMEEVESLVHKGYAFCAIDVRGLGISYPRFPRAGPLFYGYDDPDSREGYAWAGLTLGAPVLGQRVWDLLSCLAFLGSLRDLAPDPIHLLGMGNCGLVALLGAVLARQRVSLLLSSTLADFRSVVGWEDYTLRLPWFAYGFLREFDLPDLVAALAPQPCWLWNSTGPLGKGLSESDLRDRYRIAATSYAGKGAEGKLRFLVQPDENRLQLLATWLSTT